MFFNSIAFSIFLSIIFVYAPEYIEGQIFTKKRGEVMSLYTKYSHQYNIPFYDFLLMLFTIKKNIFIIQITLTKWGLNYLLPNLLTH